MVSVRPPDFGALLADLARELQARNVPFMLIGGQAVLLHGAPRVTEDIDVTLGFGPDEFETVSGAGAALGLVPLVEDAEAFCRETYVYPVRHEETAIRVDFIFSDTVYEREAIGRAVGVVLDEVTVPFASAEDLILHKLFAGRPRDIEDAESVVRRQEDRLDWSYIEGWARRFAEVPERGNLWEQVLTLRNLE